MNCYMHVVLTVAKQPCSELHQENQACVQTSDTLNDPRSEKYFYLGSIRVNVQYHTRVVQAERPHSINRFC